MAFQIEAKIINNKRVGGNYFHLTMDAANIAHKALPGQFVNIKVNDSLDPLVRRPLSIHGVKDHNIEILYEVVGKGSNILSQKKHGEHLDAIGPLGNGFDYRPAVGSRPILIAGGMGAAPLTFLAEKLEGVKNQKSKVKTLVLIGAKTKNHIPCEKDFKELGCEVKIATDDGSKGFRGCVPDLLKHLLSTIDYRLSTIYACGPHPMLKETANIAKQRNIPAQVSLEEHMCCGIGACLGCVVDTKGGYKRVCKEGPVFSAEEIIW